MQLYVINFTHKAYNYNITLKSIIRMQSLDDHQKRSIASFELYDRTL